VQHLADALCDDLLKQPSTINSRAKGLPIRVCRMPVVRGYFTGRVNDHAMWIEWSI